MLRCIVAASLLASVVAPRAALAQKPGKSVGLATTTLAGQRVPVLPITLLVATPELHEDSAFAPYRDRKVALAWADSTIGDVLQGHAPEVEWVLPPELRKVARRAAGFVPNPDDMGQAVTRSPGMKKLPDPLRSSVRTLVALSNGRYVFIPAAVGFARDSAGIRADLIAVVADGRTGIIIWHTVVPGHGSTPSVALRAALTAMLPGEEGL